MRREREVGGNGRGMASHVNDHVTPCYRSISWFASTDSLSSPLPAAFPFHLSLLPSSFTMPGKAKAAKPSAGAKPASSSRLRKGRGYRGNPENARPAPSKADIKGEQAKAKKQRGPKALVDIPALQNGKGGDEGDDEDIARDAQEMAVDIDDDSESEGEQEQEDEEEVVKARAAKGNGKADTKGKGKAPDLTFLQTLDTKGISRYVHTFV